MKMQRARALVRLSAPRKRATVRALASSPAASIRCCGVSVRPAHHQQVMSQFRQAREALAAEMRVRARVAAAACWEEDWLSVQPSQATAPEAARALLISQVQEMLGQTQEQRATVTAATLRSLLIGAVASGEWTAESQGAALRLQQEGVTAVRERQRLQLPLQLTARQSDEFAVHLHGVVSVRLRLPLSVLLPTAPTSLVLTQRQRRAHRLQPVRERPGPVQLESTAPAPD
jgi:hypothetical protein